MQQLLSRLYGTIIQLRNSAFDRGLLRSHRAPVPVISVGNITAGGSGKTPVVEYLLGLLREKGWHPAVVTRGYRRESKGLVVVSDGVNIRSTVAESGDEAMQIAKKFPDVAVIASEKRIDGARHAAERCGADLVVLDDAFQHRAIARDLDVVVFDASEPSDRHRLLPAGRLREPLSNLSRADIILLSRCSEISDAEMVERSLRDVTAAPVFPTRFAVRGLRVFGSTEKLSADAMKGKDVYAFSGIGTPAAFERTLRELGMVVRDITAFPDHHWFSADDLRGIAKRAGELGVDTVITTEKDAVRIADPEWGKQRFRVLFPELCLEFLSGEGPFNTLLEDAIPHRS